MSYYLIIFPDTILSSFLETTITFPNTQKAIDDIQEEFPYFCVLKFYLRKATLPHFPPFFRCVNRIHKPYYVFIITPTP